MVVVKMLLYVNFSRKRLGSSGVSEESQGKVAIVVGCLYLYGRNAEGKISNPSIFLARESLGG